MTELAALPASIRKHCLPIQQALAIWEVQDGLCAVCHQPLVAGDIQTDHDHGHCPDKHSCGECVRGFVCSRCNVLVAQYETGRAGEYVLALIGPYISDPPARPVPVGLGDERTCDWCGCSIVHLRSDATYCSRSHKRAASRARNRGYRGHQPKPKQLDDLNLRARVVEMWLDHRPYREITDATGVSAAALSRFFNSVEGVQALADAEEQTRTP